MRDLNMVEKASAETTSRSIEQPYGPLLGWNEWVLWRESNFPWKKSGFMSSQGLRIDSELSPSALKYFLSVFGPYFGKKKKKKNFLLSTLNFSFVSSIKW